MDLVFKKASFKPAEPYADLFTREYECDDYRCMGHPQGCMFCEHLTDVWWDYSHGPYMFLCELGTEDTDPTQKGIIGQCEHFKEDYSND